MICYTIFVFFRAFIEVDGLDGEVEEVDAIVDGNRYNGGTGIVEDCRNACEEWLQFVS